MCGVVLFFGGLVSLWGNKHVLSIMMSVECLFLSVFCLMCFCLSGFDLVPLMILLVLSVCEAGIMLSVLVRLVRGHGNDFVLSLGVLGC